MAWVCRFLRDAIALMFLRGGLRPAYSCQLIRRVGEATASIQLGAGRFDELAELHEIRLHDARELFRRIADDVDAETAEALNDVRQGHDTRRFCVQPRDDVAG